MGVAAFAGGGGGGRRRRGGAFGATLLPDTAELISCDMVVRFCCRVSTTEIVLSVYWRALILWND